MCFGDFLSGIPSKNTLFHHGDLPFWELVTQNVLIRYVLEQFIACVQVSPAMKTWEREMWSRNLIHWRSTNVFLAVMSKVIWNDAIQNGICAALSVNSMRVYDVWGLLVSLLTSPVRIEWTFVIHHTQVFSHHTTRAAAPEHIHERQELVFTLITCSRPSSLPQISLSALIYPPTPRDNSRKCGKIHNEGMTRCAIYRPRSARLYCRCGCQIQVSWVFNSRQIDDKIGNATMQNNQTSCLLWSRKLGNLVPLFQNKWSLRTTSKEDIFLLLYFHRNL